MQDIIIEEKVEKIVIDSPIKEDENNVVNTLEFQKQMRDFDYKVEGEDIILTGVKFERKTVKVPMGVTKIGKDAFSIKNRKTKNFENIILPKSVYEIEESAFEENYFIKNIDMSGSSVLKIGKMAFCYCNWLKSVKLPVCLNEIGISAFYRNFPKCQMNVVLPKHTKISDNAFDQKTTLEYYKPSDAVEVIKQGYDKQLENLKADYDAQKQGLLEQNNQQIKSNKEEQKNEEKNQLNQLKKEKLFLEKELEKLKNKLKEKESCVIDIKYNDDEIMTFDKKMNLLFKNVKGIKKLILNDFSKVEFKKLKKFINLEVVEFVQSNSDLEIKEFSFCKNKKIKCVKIQSNGNDVYVRSNAFLWCEELEYFDFSDVVSIGALAFCGCEKLKVVRSSKLNDIWNFAFSHCKSLEELDLSDVCGKVHIMDYNSFEDCPKLNNIILNSDSGLDIDRTFKNRYKED